MHQAPRNGPFQTQNYIDISLSCFAQNQNMSNKKELELFLCIESRPWYFGISFIPIFYQRCSLSDCHFSCQIICRYSFTKKTKNSEKEFWYRELLKLYVLKLGSCDILRCQKCLQEERRWGSTNEKVLPKTNQVLKLFSENPNSS